MSQGTRRPMTKPHLGGRGAGRQLGYTKIAAPRGVDRRRGHGDGRHHPRSVAQFFFTKFCQRTWGVNCFPFLCSWTRPNVSKPALAQLPADALRTEALPFLEAQSVRFPFDRPAIPSNGRALSFFRAGVTPIELSTSAPHCHI